MKKSKVTKKEVVKVKPLSKKQFYKHFVDNFDLKMDQVKEIFDGFLELVYKEAKSEKGITIPGLGKVICKKRPARMGRNPKTGETIKISARTGVKFRLAKAAKLAILGEQLKTNKKVKK